MSTLDLKGIKPGDLAEYQQPASKSPLRGTFQHWHSTADGQARLLVHSHQLGIDIQLNPRRIISITHQSEGSPWKALVAVPVGSV
jgi:hypothetical protein